MNKTTTAAAKPALSLAYFIVRSQSLFFYRDILKTLRQVDPIIAKEIHREVKQKFESSRGIIDASTCRRLLAEGRVEFKQLTNIMSLSAHSSQQQQQHDEE